MGVKYWLMHILIILSSKVVFVFPAKFLRMIEKIRSIINAAIGDKTTMDIGNHFHLVKHLILIP